MKPAKAIALVVSLFLLLMLSVSPAVAKVFKMKFASMDPPGAGDTLTADWWASQVEKRTEGRVKIERFWSGSLIGGYEQLHAVKTGVIQLTFLYSGYHPKNAPLTVITLLPCMNVGLPKVSFAATDELMKTNKAIIAELKGNNVKYLFPFTMTNHYLWSMVPMRTLDDFDGLRLRSWGFNYTLFKKWGCGMVSLPVPEVYDSLERKAVDATTMYISNGVSLRLHEVVKYLNVTELGHNLGCPAVINLDTWNRLPADIRKIIEEVNAETVDKCTEIATESYRKGMAAVKDAGLIIQRFPPEEEKVLTEVSRKEIWETYAKKLDKMGVPGTKTLQHYVELLKKYEKIYRH